MRACTARAQAQPAHLRMDLVMIQHMTGACSPDDVRSFVLEGGAGLQSADTERTQASRTPIRSGYFCSRSRCGPTRLCPLTEIAEILRASLVVERVARTFF